VTVTSQIEIVSSVDVP